MQKYASTHHVIVGGDFNEDISSQKAGRRQQGLSLFLEENKLSTKPTGKTYVSPGGSEIRTLDYVFFGDSLEDKVKHIQSMDSLTTNVSDHYPIMCVLDVEVRGVSHSAVSLPQSSKVKWDKIDKDAYTSSVAERLAVMRPSVQSFGILDVEIQKLNSILTGAAQDLAPKKVKRHRKAKLKVYGPEIKKAIKVKKEAFWLWKEGNRPMDSNSTLVINKKHTTNYLHKLCRIEAAREREQFRQEILDARSTDTKLFHKLVNKQRGNRGGCVNELTANGHIYRTEEGILNGWRDHFETLATPNDNEDFDMKYARLVSDEVPVISDLCNTSESVEITPGQIRKANRQGSRLLWRHS